MNCLFCDKDLSNEKFREDYILIPVADDPDEPKSLNKIAKPVHTNCFLSFLMLNNLRGEDNG